MMLQHTCIARHQLHSHTTPTYTLTTHTQVLHDTTQYGGPGSWLLVSISIITAWISKMTMDQIAFVISITSGLLASVSFTMRILADYKKIRKPKHQTNEQVVDEPK